MQFGWNILSLLVWVPIVAGLVVIGLSSRNYERLSAGLGLAASLLVFALSLVLWQGFDTSTAAFQFVEQVAWIEAFNIQYYVGVDGISLPLIVLSTFISCLAIYSAFGSIRYRLGLYVGAFLVLEGFMIGVFVALDGVLFYIFWEALLIPMFLIIGVWGGERRVYAALKLFLYTFAGSIFMLVALIYMSWEVRSFAIDEFQQMPLSLTEQGWIFWAFLLAFAVKIPMVPVHTWLPDAHVEAPTAGSVVLAAILLKMGGYGFVRFCLPIVPGAVAMFDWLVILLSLIAVVYIGFVAMAQEDMKKLIAYSSISHMGFVTLGIFVVIPLLGQPAGALALEGAMVQMISHGFISAALFFMIGVLYDRMHTREISAYGGVIQKMPVFGLFVVLFAMANAGLPGTSGFVGEFMVILAAFQANIWYAVFAGSTLVIGAIYTLWMVKRVFYGEVANQQVAALQDLNFSEKLIMTILAVVVIGVGVYPNFLVAVMHESVSHLLQQLEHSSKLLP